MNKKRIAIIAVVLFLILGVGTSVFADDPNNEIYPENNNYTNNNNINKIEDNPITNNPSEDNSLVNDEQGNIDSDNNSATNEQPDFPNTSTPIPKPQNPNSKPSINPPVEELPIAPIPPIEDNQNPNPDDSNKDDTNDNNNSESSDSGNSSTGGSGSGKPSIPENPEEKDEIDKIIEDIKKEEINQKTIEEIKDLIAKLKEELKNGSLDDLTKLKTIIEILKDKLNNTENLDEATRQELEDLIKEIENLIASNEIIKDIENLPKDEIDSDKIDKIKDLIDKLEETTDNQKLDDTVIEEIKKIIDEINEKLEDSTLDETTKSELEEIKNNLENIITKEELKEIKEMLDKIKEDIKNNEQIDIDELNTIKEKLQDKLNNPNLSEELKQEINNIIKDINNIIKNESILKELDKLIEELKKNPEKNKELIEELEKLKEKLEEQIKNGEVIDNDTIKDITNSILDNNPNLSEEEKDILDNIETILNNDKPTIEALAVTLPSIDLELSNHGFTNGFVRLSIKDNNIATIKINDTFYSMSDSEEESAYTFIKTISDIGHYKVVATDLDGNISEFEFTITDKPYVQKIMYALDNNIMNISIYTYGAGSIQTLSNKWSKLSSIKYEADFEITSEDKTILDEITIDRAGLVASYRLIYENGLVYLEAL